MDLKRQKILNQLRINPVFIKDRKYLLELIDTYKTVSREKTYELHDLLTSHAIKQNWSRRKLDVLIYGLVLEIKHNDNYSSDLYDLLTNYIDALEGDVSYRVIIRLNNDPKDDDELITYVRSGKWWDEDFYN